MKKKTAALSVSKQTLRNLSENQAGPINWEYSSMTSGSAAGGNCCTSCRC